MHCNSCRSDQLEKLFEVSEQITGKKKPFAVVQCRDCGLAFTDPQPSKAELGIYYPKESYYSFQPTDYGTIKERLRNICLEEIGGYPRPTGNDLISRVVRGTVAAIFGGNISVIIPYLQSGKILDVGCGSGRFIKWLKDHGWNTYGVELSEKATQYAIKSGLNVFCGDLMEAAYPASQFDTILINQVLEHVPDPMGLLREVSRILKPGGLLIVGVPNLQSYESMAFGKYWSQLDIPRHLYHFSYPVLEDMLGKSGFSIEKTIGKMFFIPYSNRQSLRQLAGHESKLIFLRALIAVYLMKFPYYLLHGSKETQGEFITIYARKNSPEKTRQV